MSRTNKILVATLTISMLLNFAAAGYIGVRLIRDQIHHSFFDRSASDAHIPVELKNAFRKALRADRAGLLKALRELGTAREKLHHALVAETLDLHALETAQADVRTATDLLIAHLQNALRVAAADLPDNVRQSLPKFRIGRDLVKKLESATE